MLFYLFPALAVIAAILPWVRPLCRILQADLFESHTTQRSEKELFEMAVERGVSDTYGNLMHLGFQPFGTNYSKFKSNSDHGGEEDVFVFHHLEIPFVALLSVLPDEQINVEFISGDLNGRVLVTTSLKEGGVNMRDAQGWYQTLKTKDVREIYEKHKLANEEWTQQGFEAQLIESTNQLDQVVVEQLNMPISRQMILMGPVILGLGSLVFSLFFPLVICAIATGVFPDWSWLTTVNWFAITSLVGSAIWYFGVTVSESGRALMDGA